MSTELRRRNSSCTQPSLSCDCLWSEQCSGRKAAFMKTSHQAKEWYTVVSELTQHLNRVRPPLMTQVLLDGSTTELHCQEDAAQDQVLSEAWPHHEASTCPRTTGGCRSQSPLGHPEVFYDEVPAEGLHLPADDDIYEEIQTPERHISRTSRSSSEVHCYEDLSDGQRTPPGHSRTTLPAYGLRLPECCAPPRQEQLPSPPHRHSWDTKVQRLIKAVRDSSKDRLEKNRSAMIRKRTFLKRKDCTGDGKEDWGYVDVCVCDLKPPAPQLGPMPEGLSAQQVPGMALTHVNWASVPAEEAQFRRETNTVTPPSSVCSLVKKWKTTCSSSEPSCINNSCYSNSVPCLF